MSVRGLSIRIENMHTHKFAYPVLCSAFACDYARRTLNEIECRISFQAIYVAKSQFGGFAFLLFRTMMTYMQGVTRRCRLS